MDKKSCDNLKSLRKESGFTQKQVASKLGVVESCYANWEQGRAEPDIENIRNLSEIFNTDLDTLLNGDL